MATGLRASAVHQAEGYPITDDVIRQQERLQLFEPGSLQQFAGVLVLQVAHARMRSVSLRRCEQRRRWPDPAWPIHRPLNHSSRM